MQPITGPTWLSIPLRGPFGPQRSGDYAGKADAKTKGQRLCSKPRRSAKSSFRAYIDNDFKDASKVYEKVYGCSAKSAVSAASRLLKDVNIQEMMAAELAETMKIARIPAEKRVVDTWMKRAFYDVADIIDTQGALKHTMDELQKRGLSVCIDGIDVKPDKDGGEHYVYKLRTVGQGSRCSKTYAQIIKPFL